MQEHAGGAGGCASCVADEEREIASAVADGVDVDSELDEELDVDLEPIDSEREDELKAHPDASVTGDRQDFTAGQRDDEAR